MRFILNATLSPFCSDEIKMIRYASYIRSILSSFTMYSTRLSIFASLVVFAYTGNLITAKIAFTVTAYYYILRLLMSTMFTKGK